MNKNTANHGAAQTRAEIKRYIRRMRTRRSFCPPSVNEALDDLVDFINSMAKRAGKRTGGLGRR